MTVRNIFFTFLAIVFLAQSGQAAVYYVAKSGNDSNPGSTTNLAFLTIQKAASVMNAGDTCYIFSGTYRETVVPAHSGTAGLPITFAAYPGAIPIVSGANPISLTWNVYSNSIYQASTTSSFRQLFVDGVMMNEARWPNATVNNLLYAPRSTPNSCTLTNLMDSSLPNVNLLGATLHIFPNEYNNSGYAANTRLITAWDPVAKKLSWNGNIFNSGATATYYYIYGALPLLDISTEWYLDTNAKVLYLWCPDSASPTNHTVEIKARTSAFTLDNLAYITVNGLYVFAAGISMANTTDCIVNNCNLEYVQHNTTADWTMDVPIANQVSGSGSMWENSTIKYSSQDGIRCSGQNEVVSNCVIQQVDYYPGTYYAAVTAYSGGNGTRILNNTFTYSGRYLVGASATDVDIAYNDLGFGTLLTSDGGATYVYVGGGNGNGTIIHHNWAHNCWAGVYVDQGQNNYIVYRNVCYSNANGMCFNSFTNNLFINNTAVSNGTDLLCNGGGDINVSFINNIWHSTSQNNAFSGSTTLTDDGWYPPLGSNYVPQTGSGAIDGGEVYSPYTDGYIGAAPDIGAYEAGGTYWVPGANFEPEPFPNPYSFPVITVQPSSQTNYIDQTAVFSVTAGSIGSQYYQWMAGATGSGIYTNLLPDSQIASVTNATLTISNLTFANTADYMVVVSNSNGPVNSAVATLTVLSPAPTITMQPSNQTSIVGQSIQFTVGAAGLAQLSYQWMARVAGGGVYANLPVNSQITSVTNATLTISNLTLANAADYLVVITNSYGSVTSAKATLTILTNSSYQTTILADHPVSYWPLNEMGGTVIHDVAGTNNGTAMNTAGLTFGGPGVLYSNGVNSDTAIYFQNTNSGYIRIPYSSTLNTPNFSVETWLKMPIFPVNGAGADMNPLSFDVAFNPYGWTFEIAYPNGANPLLYGWLASGGAWTRVNSGTSLQGSWSYYVLTYDGTSFKVYTNGVLAVSSSSGYAQATAGTPLYLGAYNNSGSTRFYNGGMENVAEYNYALTPTQISEHYEVGSTGIPLTPPMMSIQISGNKINVGWGSGYLQAAPTVHGPWTYVTNTAPPYSTGLTNQTLFFRSISPSP